MALKRILRGKLHGATVTDANLAYQGSIAIDQDLMDLAGITPYEFVLISNANNGNRFETYVIPGARGSGMVCLNGATARMGLPGDRVFIFSTAYLTEAETAASTPSIVFLDEKNRPVKK